MLIFSYPQVNTAEMTGCCKIPVWSTPQWFVFHQVGLCIALPKKLFAPQEVLCWRPGKAPNKAWLVFNKTYASSRSPHHRHDVTKQLTFQRHPSLDKTHPIKIQHIIPAIFPDAILITMASRILTPASRMLRANGAPAAARCFSMSARRVAPVGDSPLPVRKPVGAFRGGWVGELFSLGSLGSGVWGEGEGEREREEYSKKYKWTSADGVCE